MKENHKHKMVRIRTENIHLTNGHGMVTAKDKITYKVCTCGFKEPVGHERTKYDNPSI